jgi:putative addiction module component (TIGR02574 family)
VSNVIENFPVEDYSPEERLELIGRLWDSLENHEIPIPEWQRAEIDRRCEEMKANPEIGIPWEEVKARLMDRR